MMMRSWSNTLVSVRQVTQRNAGRKTAGIDGQVALTSQARMDLAVPAHHTARSSSPSRSAGCTYRRPMGNKDRSAFPSSRTASTRRGTGNALEPEWEARLAPKTYGFRPGRSCQDAISVIHVRRVGRTPAGRGCWTRTSPRHSTGSTTTSFSPRWVRSPQGHDPGLVEGGCVRAGQRIRPDRGGNSPRRCDFTVATERRVARAGGGGRSPTRGERCGERNGALLL